ncbi:MAG: hypothetical protein EOO99_11590 [Pedobacter sp.]|nr:MAG: hypothetical protein EOO99_11590 [Pedobacter sp.]
MPQFDFASFSVQIFWLVLSSFTFFLIYTKYFIANSSNVLKMREKLKAISSSLNNGKGELLGYYDLCLKFFRNK